MYKSQDIDLIICIFEFFWRTDYWAFGMKLKLEQGMSEIVYWTYICFACSLDSIMKNVEDSLELRHLINPGFIYPPAPRGGYKGVSTVHVYWMSLAAIVSILDSFLLSIVLMCFEK